MRFFTPWGLLALIAIPLIIMMYLLKQKYQEKEVPSLYLWKKALHQSQAQAPWQKLRRSKLLFLQLIIATLLAFALGGPYFMGKSQVVDYVLALDCSVSMQAQDVGGSRFEAAKRDMISLVEEASPDSSFSFVQLTDAPRLVIRGTQEKQRVLQHIRGAEVTNGGVDWVSGKGLLEGEKGALGGEVVLYTDDYGRLDDLSPLERIYNGNGDNTALTMLSYTTEEDSLSVLVRVAHWGEVQTEKTLTLYADGVAFDTKSFSPVEGETLDIVFQGVPRGTKTLVARVFPEDALGADDVIFEGVNEGVTQKVLLVTEGNLFLEKAFSLMDQVELYKTTMENATNLSGYSLYVFDGALPEVLPTDGFIMAFAPGGTANPLIGSSAERGISTQVRGSTHLGDIDKLSFAVEKATPLILEWGKPLLRAGEDNLAVFGERQGRKTAVFGFDLHHSDLPLKAGFPILLYRLLEWYFPQVSGGIVSVSAGATIDFPLAPETQKATVSLPDGRKIDIAPPFPPKAFLETGETGLYTFVEENAVGVKTERAFGVNPRTEGESDLRLQGEAAAAGQAQVKTIATGKPLVAILILLLLAVLMIEWWVNCRER